MEEKQPPQKQSTLDDTSLCKFIDEFEKDLKRDCESQIPDDLLDKLDQVQVQTQSSQHLPTILDSTQDAHDLVKCYFSSKEVIAAYLIDLIDAAKKIIYVAMYQLRVADVSRALIRAQARRVKVLLICDKCAKNEKAIQLLLKYGIEVFVWKGDGPRTLMHHKFALFDDDVVWTGSFNWTYSAKDNCENAIVFKNRKIYTKYFDEFNNVMKESYPLQYSKDPKSDQQNRKKRKRKNIN